MKCLIGLPLLIHIELLWRSRSRCWSFCVPTPQPWLRLRGSIPPLHLTFSRRTDTPRVTQFEVTWFQTYAFFFKLKWSRYKILEIRAKFFFAGTKVTRCWRKNTFGRWHRQRARSCFCRSGSSVLEFVFQRNSIMYTYTVDRMYTQFRLARNSA
jgi:hypothetical protein